MLTHPMAWAQDNGILNKEKALWLESGNSALMETSGKRTDNTAGLSYGFITGEHHLFQEPQSSHNVRFNTAGYATIGKSNYGDSSPTTTSPIPALATTHWCTLHMTNVSYIMSRTQP